MDPFGHVCLIWFMFLVAKPSSFRIKRISLFCSLSTDLLFVMNTYLYRKGLLSFFGETSYVPVLWAGLPSRLLWVRVLKVKDILLLCLIWHHYKCVILSLLGSWDGNFCTLISRGSYWFLEILSFCVLVWVFFPWEDTASLKRNFWSFLKFIGAWCSLNVRIPKMGVCWFNVWQFCTLLVACILRRESIDW